MRDHAHNLHASAHRMRRALIVGASALAVLVLYIVYNERRAVPVAALLPSRAVANVAQRTRIRVACIGDSLTEPSGVPACGKSKKITHYPCALSKLLGANFDVRPFGCSKATAHDSGEKAWVQRCKRKRAAAIAWEPHIVVVLFGTNDAMPEYKRAAMEPAEFPQQVTSDLLAIIGAFTNLTSAPAVLTLLPPADAAHVGRAARCRRRGARGLARAPRDFGERRAAGAAARAAAGRGAARPRPCSPPWERTGALELLDLSDVLAIDEANFHDGLHPSSAGATKIAKAVAGRLQPVYGGRTCVSGACCRRLEKD